MASLKHNLLPAWLVSHSYLIKKLLPSTSLSTLSQWTTMVDEKNKMMGETKLVVVDSTRDLDGEKVFDDNEKVLVLLFALAGIQTS